MTQILALETATTNCSVALWQNGEVLERFEPAARRQTERILPMVDALLAEAGIPLSRLDGIAFGQGPGAFTGVRVAVSVAQGLAFAADLPVIGISTLAACALCAHDAHPEQGWVLPAFDARMGELYLGAYRAADGQVEPLHDDGLYHPQALPAARLAGHDWLLAGSGACYRDEIGACTKLIDVDENVAPRATAVARLAVPQLAAGQTLPAEQARPVYLRNDIVQKPAPSH